MCLKSPPTFTGPFVYNEEPSGLLHIAVLFDQSAWTVETAATISLWMCCFKSFNFLVAYGIGESGEENMACRRRNSPL